MITSYDLVTVQGEFVTVDLLVWRRYKMQTTGIMEALLDANPHLSRLHKDSPFLPIGTQVRIPIDDDVLKGMPQPSKINYIYGRV